jgi:formate hydrogenlyase subunit 3/multisubunit Na+/H+ antiporter MnhD subunit
MNAVAWTAPLLLPVLAAALALLAGRVRPWLPAITPLPALALALLGPPGPAPDLSWVLLDLRLGLDPVGRVLLATTALVWLGGGAAARSTMRRRPGSAALWQVTLAGNVGVVLAADVVSLYVAFAVMTFAAYGLVVHERDEQAWRAGRVYLVLAVLGEAMLLSGLMLAVGATGTTSTGELATLLADAPRSTLTVVLLTAGFAVKAGIVPLHVWLPLAHPAAPVPASAVLSGAMVKAGLVGWLAVLPIGAAGAAAPGAVLLLAGLVTAAAGIALGLPQHDPKVLLAYSTVSQMGMIAVLVGVGLLVPGAAPVSLAAAALYALHHGCNKAALFLGVGVHARLTGAGARRWVLAATAFAGLALAGAPLTGGWVAKVAMKDVADLLPAPWPGRLTLVLSLLAAGTTALLARLVLLLARRPPSASTAGSRPDGSAASGVDRWALTAGAGLLVAGLAGAWLTPALLTGALRSPSISVASLLQSLWPVTLGLGATAAAITWRRRRTIDAPQTSRVPPGDLVVLGERAAVRLRPVLAGGRRAASVGVERTRAAGQRLQTRLRPGHGVDRIDRLLTRWRVTGTVFVLLLVVLTLTLAAGAG